MAHSISHTWIIVKSWRAAVNAKWDVHGARGAAQAPKEALHQSSLAFFGGKPLAQAQAMLAQHDVTDTGFRQCAGWKHHCTYT